MSSAVWPSTQRVLRHPAPGVRQFGSAAPRRQCLLESRDCAAGVAGGRSIAAHPRPTCTGKRRLGSGGGPSGSLGDDAAVAQRAAHEEMWVCSALAAVRGRSSPQSNSRSASADTTERLCNPSMVRMARGLAPRIMTGTPPCRTWIGPKTPSSTVGSGRFVAIVRWAIQHLVKRK
jgi:hypothetical protein